ncbi:MAG: type I restriction endonuclease [Fimbriimonadales bacterium]|jgi:hypothetical protein
MQALIQAIATVQVRIQAQSPIYADSELQTRYGLIDPILRALEWDVSNPDEVRIEHPTRDSGKADYVLMHQGKPHVVIEAKALGTSLQNAQKQAATYCKALGVSFLVCTNGDVWNFYELKKSAFVSRLELKILSSDTYKTAQDLLLLWKPLVYSPVERIPRIIPPEASSKRSRKSQGRGGRGQKSGLPQGAISLKELQIRLASGWEGSPRYIHFPGRQEIPVDSYKDMLVEIVKYVDEQGLIPPNGIKTVVIPSGVYLEKPARYSKVNSWFVCTHASTPQKVEYAIRVLEACGKDPLQVYVIVRE